MALRRSGPVHFNCKVLLQVKYDGVVRALIMMPRPADKDLKVPLREGRSQQLAPGQDSVGSAQEMCLNDALGHWELNYGLTVLFYIYCLLLNIVTTSCRITD